MSTKYDKSLDEIIRLDQLKNDAIKAAKSRKQHSSKVGKSNFQSSNRFDRKSSGAGRQRQGIDVGFNDTIKQKEQKSKNFVSIARRRHNHSPQNVQLRLKSGANQMTKFSVKRFVGFNNDSVKNDEDRAVLVSNLPSTATEADLEELFGAFAAKKITMHYNSLRRFQGSAEVVFANERNARNAINTYNNRAILDDCTMSLILLENSRQIQETEFEFKPKVSIQKRIGITSPFGCQKTAEVDDLMTKDDLDAQLDNFMTTKGMEGRDEAMTVKKMGKNTPRFYQNRSKVTEPICKEILDDEIDNYMMTKGLEAMEM